MGDILKDSRFAKYVNDPRYRQIPKHERKVKIDKRFQSMFNDSKFKVKYTVDKRGRPVNETSTENLRKYYELEDSEASSESEDEEDKDDKETSNKDQSEEAQPGRFVKRPQIDDDQVVGVAPPLQNDKLVRGKLNIKTKERLQDLDVDYARGEGVLLTDSSSDEDTSEEEEESDVEHEWGALDAEADTTEEATKRIAICNMDWDNIKATDIMVLLSSFLPPGGIIYKITIYPSEYGLKRMQEEEVRGPIELTEEREADSGLSDDGGNEEGSSYHMEKLRRYQLNRLKYYYAVVACDCAATADKLYADCDNMEYESSATRLDMRFIPDDVTFDQEPREECTSLPDLSRYKPRLFTTTALQQARVELTWDATAPARAEALRGARAGAVDDLALREYLASNSEDEADENPVQIANDSHSDNDDEDPILKYKKLLADIDKTEESKKNKEMEMEITWGLGARDKAEELVKKKLTQDDKNMTPFEQLMKKKKEKQKEKKMKKKAEREASDAESDDVPSDIDMNDPYFAEEFNKPEFKVKKSKKKQNESEPEDEEDEKRKAELELLLDDEDDGKVHFSLKKIQDAESTKKSKRKRKLKQKMLEQKQAVPDFDIDVNDKRFSALYKSHHFNIDPTDPNFKKTKNMDKLIQEKLKRRPADNPTEEEVKPKKSKEDAELSLLVKNIKRKTKEVLMK